MRHLNKENSIISRGEIWLFFDLSYFALKRRASRIVLTKKGGEGKSSVVWCGVVWHGMGNVRTA